MKRFFLLLIVVLALIYGIVYLTKTKSYVYDIPNGDRLVVEIKENGGYKLEPELPFKLMKDGKVYCTGRFISLEEYNSFLTQARTDKSSFIYDDGVKGEVEFVFYSTSSDKFIHILKVKGSDTGVVLTTEGENREIAEKCFKELTIAVAN